MSKIIGLSNDPSLGIYNEVEELVRNRMEMNILGTFENNLENNCGSESVF